MFTFYSFFFDKRTELSSRDGTTQWNRHKDLPSLRAGAENLAEQTQAGISICFSSGLAVLFFGEFHSKDKKEGQETEVN